MRHHLLHEVDGLLVGLFAIHQNFADIRSQVVAQRPDDDIAFLVDQQRPALLLADLVDRSPQRKQVVQIPLQIFLRASEPRGSNDQAHPLGNVQVGKNLANFLALLAFYTPRHSAGTRVVRHQYHVAAGETDKGGQRRALVTAFLFLDLDDQLLPFPYDVLDGWASAFDTGVGIEIASGDLLERQKAVTFSPVIYKGCFQAGLDPGDLAYVDVGFLLLQGRCFDVEVVESLAVDQGNANFLGLGGINQQSFHAQISPALSSVC